MLAEPTVFVTGTGAGAGHDLGMPVGSTLSDIFLHTHRDDERVRLCSKLAIAQTIIEHERGCALFTKNEVDRAWRDERAAMSSWLVDLVYVLQEAIVASENKSDVFKNLVIINFNYDRCVEHFLYHALRDAFQLSAVDAAELMKGLRIFHPYGVVGHLPWQGGRIVEFGADYHDLLGLSEGILTFNEQIEDDESLSGNARSDEMCQENCVLGLSLS